MIFFLVENPLEKIIYFNNTSSYIHIYGKILLEMQTLSMQLKKILLLIPFLEAI